MTDSGELQPAERRQTSVPAVYTLGSNAAERERLRRQTDDLLPHALAMLGKVDLPLGASAIDLGCGPRGMLELLAERVGPAGRVLGVDIDASHVAMARDMVASKHLANVEVVVGDARSTGLPSASFDLVSVRLMLVAIPYPGQVVAEMARLVRPGGWVVAEEGELCAVCYPPHAAWGGCRSAGRAGGRGTRRHRRACLQRAPLRPPRPPSSTPVASLGRCAHDASDATVVTSCAPL